MSLEEIVANEVVLDPSGVWSLRDQPAFGYSDGRESERYLEHAFRESTDLGSRSEELRGYIKDWPSEYHLSVKRAQLLSGFSFDRSSKVLEVGCGCGAITRYLGETFDDVVSVEGSLSRARLARLRTRDLAGVSVLCGPFQSIRFTRKFDVIFCVGVYEYSASFVSSADPYDAVLRYFRDMLTPNGVVVIAIENQFGLKYFCSSREDHVGVMFEGIEGYHGNRIAIKTFGRAKLAEDLGKYFESVRFYYPYPDYKLPDCVLADEFLAGGMAGELISQTKSRDYAKQSAPLFDEATATLELAQNRALEFFANSFLIVAGNGRTGHVTFDQLAVLYSSDRKERFAAKTTIVKRDSQLVVRKSPLAAGAPRETDAVTLVETESKWVNAYSLQTVVYLRAKDRKATLESIFAPCGVWMALLNGLATTRDGQRYISGEYFDCIWSNAYPDGEGCRLIDMEWRWSGSVRLNVIVIRAIHVFLSRIDIGRVNRCLRVRSGKALIRAIARSLGTELTSEDFAEFVELEKRVRASIYGSRESRVETSIRWFLFDRNSQRFFRAGRDQCRRLLASARARVTSLAEGMDSLVAAPVRSRRKR